MVGWVDHTVRHNGVLEELLRLAHFVGSAQFHRVAKAVQKPEEEFCLQGTGQSSISNLKLACATHSLVMDSGTSS